MKILVVDDHPLILEALHHVLRALDGGAAIHDARTAEDGRRLLAEHPLGRLGRPEDSAALVAFLCSPAGGWVNGQALACDGGYGTLQTSRRGRAPL